MTVRNHASDHPDSANPVYRMICSRSLHRPDGMHRHIVCLLQKRHSVNRPNW
jgi:hypothetical protein